jgi:hypothetical protein
LIDPKVRSTIAFSVGLRGCAGWTEISSRSQARRNVSEMNAFPRSTITVSGAIFREPRPGATAPARGDFRRGLLST